MQLSVSTYSLSRYRREFNKSLETTIDFIADAGVKGIEFSGLDEKAASDPIKRARQLRKRCEKRGLKVVSYCIGAELNLPAAKQKKVVKELKGHVDIAAELGVKSMRHDVSRGFSAYKTFKGKPTFSAALKNVVPAIREVADYAQTQGVITSLENHGYYMQGSTPVEKLLKAVDHPNFQLTIDMGNFLCVNEEPTEAVAKLAKYAVMAHVKDFHIKAKKDAPPVGWIMTPTPIAIRGAIVGHGNIDIPKEIKLLKKAKYDGFLSLEFEGLEDSRRGVSLGLEYLRTLGLS